MRMALLLLLLPAVVHAGEPRIVGSVGNGIGEVRVEVNSPPWISLSLEDAPETAIQTWAGPIGEGEVGFYAKDGVGVATGVPGAYRFRVIVQVPMDGPDTIEVYETTVFVTGQGPQPVPPPPIEDFSTKLTNAVRAAPEHHADFKRVAEAYELVAEKGKSGLLTTGQQVIAFTKVIVEMIPSFLEIQSKIIDPHIESLKQSSAADCEPVWRQIAAAIKAGLTDIPPPPDPDVLPVTSLHVLIIYESEDRSSMPASQLAILTSAKLRDWFEDNNVSWRIWDDDTPVENAEQVWQDALLLPRQSLPWIHVSNGRDGFSGPLPITVDETIELTGRYK